MNNIIFIEESESYIIRSIAEKLEKKGFPCTIILDDSGTMLTTIQEWLGGDYRVSIVNKDDSESVQRVLALKPAGYLLKTMPKEYIIEQVNVFFSKLRNQIG